MSKREDERACPCCGRPYEQGVSGGHVSITHDDGDQARTCVAPSPDGFDEPLAVFFHNEEQIAATPKQDADAADDDTTADSSETPAGADPEQSGDQADAAGESGDSDEHGPALDPADLEADSKRVFEVVRANTQDSAATLAEIKGACQQYDIHPEAVSAIVDDLVLAGFLEEPESGVVTVADGVRT